MNHSKKNRSVLSRVGVIASAALVAAVSLAGPASAHENGEKHGSHVGKKCAMSGMVLHDKKSTSVCMENSFGKLTWGKEMPVSKAALGVKDGWVKVADKGGMTGSFGMLQNKGTKPVKVVAAYSPVAKAVQLHEVVMTDGAMVMQEKKGGFPIAANGMTELKPGGNHMMFMGLNKNIKAGSLVPVTLVTSDGGRVTVKVLAKVFMGGNEEYNEGHSSTPGGMNMMSTGGK